MMPPEHERLRVSRIENAVLPMAKAALEAGQLETARRLYTRLLDVDPVSVDARMGLGDVAMAKRAPSQAANWYLAAVGHAEDPQKRHAALLAHGRAALAAGDLEAARRSFARLTHPAENASNPDAAWGFNGVGIVSLLEGRPTEAVASLEQAVLRLPNEERFHGNLARSLKLASRYRPADAAPRNLVSEDSGPPDAGAPSAGPPESQTGGLRRNKGETVEEVEEPVVAASPTEDAEPVPAVIGSAVSDGKNSDVPPMETPEPVELPSVPTGLEPSETPTEKPDRPVNAIAAAAPVTGTVEPAPAPTEVDGVQPLQETPGAAPHAIAEDAPDPEAPEAAPIEVAPPPLSFPGAFVVRLEAGEFLQVGAFTRQRNAQRSKSRLLEVVQLPVRIDSAENDGNPIYRVRVGPIQSPEVLSALALGLGVDGAQLGSPGVREEDDSPPTNSATATVSKRPEPLSDRKTEAPFRVVEDGAGFLQVGAYANRDAAAALASKLRGLTEHPVTLSEVVRGSESTLYRVRIGPVDGDSQPALLREIAAR